MKIINSLVLLFFLSLLTAELAAQSRMSGRVVDIVDGKTVVIDTDGRQIVAEIQYVEVPEPEQPMHQVVREHLAKLTLGKSAEFYPHGISPGRTIGKLYVGSVDIAVQMLRDGAAWHVSAERSGQKPDDSNAYQYHQNQARAERRGVWSVKDLKPAWEFRAEKIAKARQKEVEAEQVYVVANSQEPAERTQPKQSVRPAGPWADINPHLKDPGPLVHGYNAAGRTGFLSTSVMGVKEAEGQPAGQSTSVDITYLYRQDEQKGRSGKFIVTLHSSADDWRFLKANDLTVVADEKKFVVGKPKRSAENQNGKMVEMLTFEVSKATMERVAYGGEVFVKVGNYTFVPTPGLQLLVYNMLSLAQ
ncbi:MAG TPA: thermonuclease family protein [Pyrinomonadaceae bacterium]|nr:thermonuclease family protein [Pyrinomonadaceae bacterium]